MLRFFFIDPTVAYHGPVRREAKFKASNVTDYRPITNCFDLSVGEGGEIVWVERVSTLKKPTFSVNVSRMLFWPIYKSLRTTFQAPNIYNIRVN